jgi:beta-galactosidase
MNPQAGIPPKPSLILAKASPHVAISVLVSAVLACSNGGPVLGSGGSAGPGSGGRSAAGGSGAGRSAGGAGAGLGGGTEGRSAAGGAGGARGGSGGTGGAAGTPGLGGNAGGTVGNTTSSSGGVTGQSGAGGTGSSDVSGGSGGRSYGGAGGSGKGGATGSGGAAGADAGPDAPSSGAGGGGAGGTASAAGSLPQGYDGQRGRSFNEGWRFYLGDATGAQQPSFSDSAWTNLSVPHDWSPAFGFSQSASGQSGFMAGGVGWYRKTFPLDVSHAGKTIFIAFDGVYMNSQVWINGTSLGTWPYGYTTFQYDLTPYVKTDGSNNVIAVRVDNKQPNSRWYTGSGIYRNVWLTALNPVHVTFNGGFVTTPTVSTSSASIAVAAEIENRGSAPAEVVVKIAIFDPSGTQVASDTSPASEVATGGKTTTVTRTLTVSNPKLWSLESPNLYQARIELQAGTETVDTYLVPIGLRWTKFDANTGFYLNDKPMKIWGQCMHHDLGALGTAVNVRAIERQIEILKGMGSNGIRTSHNPPAPELLDLADRMGMLIMDEAFDVWEAGKDPAYDYHLYFDDWAQRDLQAMVRRDRNHPSVIMWSIGNEIGGATAVTGTKLRDWVKALDTTRPVTWGANHMKDDAGQRAVAAILDLQGYNYFVGDANTDTGNFQIDKDHKSNAKWVPFGSEELSNVKSRGVYTTQNTDLHWTGCGQGNSRQCSSYDVGWGDGFNTEEMYLINLRRPWFFGQFDWTGFDYGGEATPWNGQWPSKSSYFGIVDTAGFPKDIYYFYQSKLTTLPMVHVLPHWNWSAGTTVWVWVYSNCDSVELFLNDKSQGEKTIDASTTRLEWNVAWSSGTLRAVGKRGGTIVATEEVKTAGPAAEIKLSADRTPIKADGRDLVFVTADVQDASGVFVPTASNSITFSVSGPGKLAGVDNGDAADTTSYASNKRNAFGGKVLAIVQSTGQPGQITVTATASGLAQGTVSVAAQ